MTLLRLFLLVLSWACVSFGGGNILLAGLERDLVGGGFISPGDFAAGVALGQSTPGPMGAFTTAIGRAVLGVSGAVVATLGLMVVSLAVVLIIRLIPPHWFQLPVVKRGLAAVVPFIAGLVLFMAYRIGAAGHHGTWIMPATMVGGVLVGRWRKVPTVLLIVGCVALGMASQGTAVAGW